jgi:hypothetical protein
VRYLIVGTLPPPVLGRSTALLEVVGRLEAEGHEVTVHPVGVGDPASRAGGLLAAGGLDTFAGLLRASDRSSTTLVLQVEPALVGHGAGRVRRALGLLLLSAALRGWKRVEIRVDSFADLPSGVGGRAAGMLWRSADAVVVSSGALAAAVVAAGAAEGSVVVEAPRARAGAGPGAGGCGGELADGLEEWPPDSDDPDVQAVLAVVRRRAAAEQARSGRLPPDAAAAMLAAGSTGEPASPYGPLEPVIRFVYERPALREPVRRVRRLVRRSPGDQGPAPGV